MYYAVFPLVSRSNHWLSLDIRTLKCLAVVQRRHASHTYIISPSQVIDHHLYLAVKKQVILEILRTLYLLKIYTVLYTRIEGVHNTNAWPGSVLLREDFFFPCMWLSRVFFILCFFSDSWALFSVMAFLVWTHFMTCFISFKNWLFYPRKRKHVRINIKNFPNCRCLQYKCNFKKWRSV